MELKDIPSNYPWLFTGVKDVVSIEDYIGYFSYVHNDKKPFSYQAIPIMYGLPVLEEYKNNLITTTTIAPGRIISIFQLNPTTHFLSTIFPIEKNDCKVGIEFFTNNLSEYLDFLKNNKKFEKESSLNVGFLPTQKIV
jgi:hypothetical protein